MKRIFSLLVCLLLIFSVTGCNSPDDVHHASNGNIDVDVSAPDSSSQAIVIDSPIVGKWNLISITKGKNETIYYNSFYDFRESGTLKTSLNNVEQFMKYTVEGNIIRILDGATYSTISFEISGDDLLLTTQSGAKQKLVRVK